MIEDTYNNDQLECPYCHHKDRDAYELGDGGEGCGETECHRCGKEFRWVRTITVHYTGRPTNNNASHDPL
jgi:DNA-directed RNA polymerase subunit RPC12/RpoP